MKPVEEHRVEGAQLTDLEVYPILIVPTITLEVVVEVCTPDECQGMLALSEGVGIGSTGLQVEAA